MPVDPQINSVLSLLSANGSPGLAAGSPEEARRMMRFLTVDMRDPSHVVPVKETYDLTIPSPHGDMAARVYRPDRDGPVPTIVFAHGGGFVIGDVETHDNQCRALCAGADAVVVSIDYRLAPEAPWPAAVDDAYAAVRWVADGIDTLGGDRDRLVVAGDSAGGNIAAVLALRCRDTGPRLAAQLLIYPATDFDEDAPYASRIDNAEGYFLTAEDMLWFRDQYAPDPQTWRDPQLSPLHAPDVSGVAPAVVVTAEFDPLRDEGEAYADKLRAAGVPVDVVRYDGMIHGFWDMAALSDGARAAIDDGTARFRRLLWP